MLDSEFINRLKSRDPQLLEKIFLDTNPYLFKILGSNRFFGDVAKDLVQASWESFFLNLDKFQGNSQVRVFVAGILLNKIRESRRVQKRIVYEEDSEKIYEQAFTHDGWWVHEPLDPHELMQSKQVGSLIDECLEGLSESQREAFVLKEVEGENSEEICNILKVSVTNLGVLIYRAKDKLRKCLEGKIK